MRYIDLQNLYGYRTFLNDIAYRYQMTSTVMTFMLSKINNVGT